MTTLNLSDFKTVFNDDFEKDTSYNTSLWSARWGNANQSDFTDSSAGLLISSSAAADWNSVGFEQAPTGKSAGEGYGLYSFTGYAGQVGQGVGICFLLWPADNVWLPSDKPGQASEIDLLESDDGTKTGVSTIHYYDASAPGNNGQEYYTIPGLVLTQSNTYAIDWEPGSLTYYVNGQEIYQNTTHVPLDAAQGGVNETMGAEVINSASFVTTPTVQLYIQDMSYSAPVTPPPAPTITLSAPGTVAEAYVGAGVTVTETITTTGLTGSVDWGVLTASGAVESYFTPVTLNANGTASVQVHFDKSGDYVVAVNAITGATTDAIGSAVTISDPPGTPAAKVTSSISLSAPGTVAEPQVGAGVNITETATTTGLTGSIYWAVLTASGAVESYFAPVALNASGTASFQAHLAKTGDYVVAVNALTGATTDAIGAPVTISDPPGTPSATVAPSISLSAPGTVQEASPGAGVTVTETITTAGLSGSVYWGVLTASQTVETYFSPVALNASGSATVQVHLANTGDTIVAVNSLTAATAGAVAAPVTITDPAQSASATIAVAKPASLVAGVDTFTGTVTGTVTGKVEFAWHASSSGETATSSDMVTATKQANGTYTASLTVDHTGQTGYFYVAVDGTVTDEWNAIPVAAASVAASTPAFIAAAGSTAGATSAASVQSAAASVQGTSGSVAGDMVASAAKTASSASVVPAETTYHAGALMPAQAQQLASIFDTSHTTAPAG